MTYVNYSIINYEQDAWRVYRLGITVIAKYDKYQYNSHTKVWAVGLGTLAGNHDIRDYDPDRYSGIELLVLALRCNFVDIGGRGVHPVEYIELLKRYYPRNTSSVLRLVIVSSMGNNATPSIIITDEYHPPLIELYRHTTRALIHGKQIYTSDEVGRMWAIFNETIYTIILDIQNEVLKYPTLSYVGDNLPPISPSRRAVVCFFQRLFRKKSSRHK